MSLYSLSLSFLPFLLLCFFLVEVLQFSKCIQKHYFIFLFFWHLRQQFCFTALTFDFHSVFKFTCKYLSVNELFEVDKFTSLRFLVLLIGFKRFQRWKPLRFTFLDFSVEVNDCGSELKSNLAFHRIGHWYFQNSLESEEVQVSHLVTLNVNIQSGEDIIQLKILPLEFLKVLCIDILNDNRCLGHEIYHLLLIICKSRVYTEATSRV